MVMSPGSEDALGDAPCIGQEPGERFSQWMGRRRGHSRCSVFTSCDVQSIGATTIGPIGGDNDFEFSCRANRYREPRLVLGSREIVVDEGLARRCDHFEVGIESCRLENDLDEVPFRHVELVPIAERACGHQEVALCQHPVEMKLATLHTCFGNGRRVSLSLVARGAIRPTRGDGHCHDHDGMARSHCAPLIGFERPTTNLPDPLSLRDGEHVSFSLLLIVAIRGRIDILVVRLIGSAVIGGWLLFFDELGARWRVFFAWLRRRLDHS